MGSRKTGEIRELPDEELLSRLEGNKEELFNLRFQLATGQLDNPMRIKQVRHDIARVLTVLRERHKEAEVEREVARSEQQALERSRARQASGELKGTPLGEAMTEVPAGAEAPPMGMPGEFEPEAPREPEEEKPRRRRGLRRRRDDEEQE